jgi:hypothetical protein
MGHHGIRSSLAGKEGPLDGGAAQQGHAADSRLSAPLMKVVRALAADSWRWVLA